MRNDKYESDDEADNGSSDLPPLPRFEIHFTSVTVPQVGAWILPEHRVHEEKPEGVHVGEEIKEIKLNMVVCSGSKPHCADSPQLKPECATCHHAIPHWRDGGCNHLCWASSEEQHTCHTIVSIDQWWDEIPEEPDYD